MSRSGYSDDNDDNWSLIKWRGQVASAIRGKRGQAFLRELIEALDTMPEKRLIANDLQTEKSVCALGSVGLKRGIDLAMLDPEDHPNLAIVFGIAPQLVAEIEFENDDALLWNVSAERRWQYMRDWAERHLIEWTR